MQHDLDTAAEHLRTANAALCRAAAVLLPEPPDGNDWVRRQIGEGLVALSAAAGAVSWLQHKLAEVTASGDPTAAKAA